jgi:asparagine synthase (glutamine-hydrolysing)
MCGIIGIIGQRPREWHRTDLASLHHRGPDAQDGRLIGTVALGHTRLSIIDLAAGAQPMSDVHGHATIVFNGEIYNHAALRAELEGQGQRFATRSDTETILAAYLAWGVAGFARLRGMYALALHDHRDGSTLLVRDPFGIKPLFVAQEAGEVFFASEQAALIDLLDHPPEIDPSSVLETLLHRHPFGEHTLYRGVKRLAPGAALIVSRGGQVREQRFADLPTDIDRAREIAAHATPDDARARVEDSVAHHAIADVPVGCFLSGGLDSSIVSQALTGRVTGRLQAFSVGFADAQTEASELPYARLVAQAIGADLTEVTVGPEDFASLAPRLSGTLNGPFPDPADIAMLKLSATARPVVKVVLTGEGSDESFAGYPKYAADRHAGLMRLPMSLADRLLRRQGRIGIAASALAERDRAARWMRWFENDAVPEPVVAGLLAGGADRGRAYRWVNEQIAGYPADWTDMQRMQMLDLASWLPNNLLHRGDYTTMQASLEQRVPLLDIELTPWAVALPDGKKVAGMKGKRILKEAFAAKLPPEVVQRRKSGFRFPLGEWLRTDRRLRERVGDHLLSPDAGLRAFAGKADLERLLTPEALATTGGAKLAWTSYCLELWLSALARRSAPKLAAAE